MGNYELIRGNAELMKKESIRISTYLNEKYKNSPEFRQQKIDYVKAYRIRKRAEKAQRELEEKQNEVSALSEKSQKLIAHSKKHIRTSCDI